MPVYPQINTPTEARAKRLSVLQTQMEMQEAQNKAAQENQLRQFYQQYGPGVASGDPRAISELSRIDPTAAQTFQQTAGDIRQSEFENDQAEMQAVSVGLQAVISDETPDEFKPMLYSSTLANWARRGVNTEAFPQQYVGNEEQIETMTRGLMSIDDQNQQRRIELEAERQDPQAAGVLAEAKREPIGLAAERQYATTAASRQAQIDYPTPSTAAPSTTFVRVRGADGSEFTARASDPSVDQALSAGGEIVEDVSDDATETQRITAVYADRASEANTIIRDVEPAGLIRRYRMLGGTAGDYIPFSRTMVSDEFQQLDQAERNFINAVLRRESGAVISEEEFENARRQYFPQPGDREPVLEQKRQNRATTIRGLEAAAGPALQAVRANAPAQTLPEEARSQLQEGEVTTFANGQSWTLENGTPRRVR